MKILIFWDSITQWYYDLENWWWVEKNLEKLIFLSKKHTKKIVFIWLTNVNEKLASTKKDFFKNNRIKKFDEIIKKIAIKNNCDYLEIFDLLKNSDLEDWLHPNNLGHKKIFEKVKEKLENNMEKILSIHWKWSDINSSNWIRRKKIFLENDMILDAFQFDRNIDPTYESWKKTFEKINFSKYEKIFVNSLWWLMVCKYLDEKKIKLKKLVMTVPWKSISVEKWLRPNMLKIYDDFEKNWFDLNIDKIIIIHAKDDKKVPFENGKNFAKKIWAKFIALEEWWHSLEKYFDFTAKIVKNGV